MTSKTTLVSDIWKLFYDRIKSTVTTTTLSDGSLVTIQAYDSNFSDRPLESNDYYPVIVINTPSMSTDTFTSGKDIADCKIDIELYTFQAMSADKFLAQIQDTIETYKKILADNKLRKVKVEDISTDMFQRGSIKVHVRRIRFGFKFIYAKTLAY